ncbi:hypothetical protein FIM12_03230 [SAR202 cluster bacterium AD-804-J14_MRT_500m]|nr:hypothetical protein [SAR202 cluster bacterium AD-804-J14_MRT_500m]
MRLNGLNTIEDFSNQDILDVLNLAKSFRENLRGYSDLLAGYIMASLFFEPSTRTRGSFESAMKRLGGQTITTSDVRGSSIEKGESLADTIRVWSGYCDLMVMRHPWEGASNLAESYSQVPVINAGDGGHEHPTQTLCDLFTLREEHGTLDGLRVVLCGDLKNGRTVHSLTFALLRFGAQLIFVPGEGLGLPDHIKRRIGSVYGTPIEKVKPVDLDLGALFRGGGPPSKDGTDIDAVYMTPSRPHQLAIYQEDVPRNMTYSKDSVDLYFTRHQKERDSGSPRKSYPKVSRQALRRKGFSKAMIMHPLPRVDEISTELDEDPRSRYFEQARNGVPVRMALLALLLRQKPWSDSHANNATKFTSGFLVAQLEGVNCDNLNCVSQKEPQNCDGKIVVHQGASNWFLCKYCEREVHVSAYVYKGKKIYHDIQQLEVKSYEQLSRIRFYSDWAEAESHGLTRAHEESKDRSKVKEVGF